MGKWVKGNAWTEQGGLEVVEIGKGGVGGYEGVNNGKGELV